MTIAAFLSSKWFLAVVGVIAAVMYKLRAPAVTDAANTSLGLIVVNPTDPQAPTEAESLQALQVLMARLEHLGLNADERRELRHDLITRLLDEPLPAPAAE